MSQIKFRARRLLCIFKSLEFLQAEKKKVGKKGYWDKK